jgi:hypothetical protein
MSACRWDDDDHHLQRVCGRSYELCNAELPLAAFTRLHHLSDGKTGPPAVTAMSGWAEDVVATATVESGTAWLIRWDVVNEKLVRRGEHGAPGFFDDIRAVEIPIGAKWVNKHTPPPVGSYVVTIAGHLGDLRLRSWSLSGDGGFIEHGWAKAGPVGALLDVASLPPDRFLLAVKTKTGRSKLIVWHVTDGGEIVRLGSAYGGMTSGVSIGYWTSSRSSRRLVYPTAAWNCSAGG